MSNLYAIASISILTCIKDGSNTRLDFWAGTGYKAGEIQAGVQELMGAGMITSTEHVLGYSKYSLTAAGRKALESQATPQEAQSE